MRAGIGVIGLAGAAFLVGTFSSSAEAQKLEGRVVEHTLGNGMKLILMERSAAPVVSAVIRFKVGAVDEAEGKTGLAHLYEHLAFRGTEVVGTQDYEREVETKSRIDSLMARRLSLLDAGERENSEAVQAIDRILDDERAELERIVVVEELDQIYHLNGAVELDATTTADLTTFMVDLPENRLPVWAILESDRMTHSIPRDFDVERSVCAKESRSRIDDDPEASLYREYLKTAFSMHPYRRPVPGWEGDLDGIGLDEAKAFYETYYSPNNAVAAVVGDIDVGHVIALAETTFGRIPRGELPRDRVIPSEPEQRETRRVGLERDAEPAIFMGFHKPSVGHPDDQGFWRQSVPVPDDLVFEILSEILTGGSSARLHQALFVEKQIAMDVASWIGPGDRYPNLFTIAARPIWPHTAQEVEEAIWVELEPLAEEHVTDEEMQRAKNHLSGDFLRGLRDNRGLAEALSYWEVVFGDWRYLEDRLTLIESIGPEEVRRCASHYLVRANCTVASIKSTRRDKNE